MTYEYSVKERNTKTYFKSLIEAFYYTYEILRGLNCEELLFEGELIFSRNPMSNKYVKKAYVITVEFPKTKIVIHKKSTGELNTKLIEECLSEFKKIIKER